MSRHWAKFFAAFLLLAAGMASASEPTAGSVWTEPATGIAFVWVPSGEFDMGCQAPADHCPATELPVHHRIIAGFWLSRTEITRGQWGRLMADDPSTLKKSDAYPVDQTTWQLANSYIAKLNKTGHGRFRLPSEAEWEYACRAGSRSDLYCGGSDVGAIAWDINNAKRSTQPVAQKAANAFGLYDMSGNLWEWTEDCWSENYEGVPADGRARVNDVCDARVMRGGSWGSYPEQLRASSRRSYDDVKCPFVGLRLVRDGGR